MVKIYGLVCPFSGEIRYIGKTVRKLEKRLSAHIGEANWLKRTSHKQRWIAKCQAAGLVPSIWLLEEVAKGERWQDRERLWIKRAKEIGLDLTNQTAGGEGLDFTDPERKAQYSATMAEIGKRLYRENPARHTAMIEGAKKSWAENRDERLAAIKLTTDTPEYKQKHAESMNKARAKPEYREGRVRVAKSNWQDHRETFMAAFAQPETKAKHSARAKRCWSDPETRERMMNRWTPAAREKQRQAALSPERQAQIAAAMTPQSRAQQGAKMKEHWAKLTPEERAAVGAKSQANKTPEGKARHSAMMKERWARYRAEKAALQEDKK